MKRLAGFWIVAAGVGAGAAITTVERSERDRETSDAAERTPSTEPTGGGDLLTTGDDLDAGEPVDAVTRKQTGTSANWPERHAERQRATAAASDTTAARAAPAAHPTTWRDAPDADAVQCPSTSRGIVVDRQWQRAWLCTDGDVATVFPITSAASQPDPGTYPVYALDYRSYSVDFGDAPSTLDRFVAFTYGKYQGARIGFHAVPYYADGTRAQPYDSVGELARLGESSGCIRVLPEHAELIYATMQVGDEVRVIS